MDSVPQLYMIDISKTRHFTTTDGSVADWQKQDKLQRNLEEAS